MRISALSRVPRIVGAYDVGRVINPKLARSQCIGGMVGGLGMALLEQAEWDGVGAGYERQPGGIPGAGECRRG